MAFKKNIALVSTVTRSHLPFARTMFASIARFHPEIRQFLILVDKPEGDCDCENATVIPVQDMGLKVLDHMVENYTNTELCVALKPFALLHALDKGFDGAIYLDNDIYAVSPFEELEHLIETQDNIILTPHLCHCEGRNNNRELLLLNYGTYNLGFIYVPNTPDAIRILQWWADWLEEYASEDVTQGVYGDQKWINLLPGFTDYLSIFRHDGYNAAYWNLRERKITSQNGKWYSNALPLRFFHFSLAKIDEPYALTSSPQGVDAYFNDILILLQEYRKKLLQNGYWEYKKLPMLLRTKPLEKKDPREIGQSSDGK